MACTRKSLRIDRATWGGTLSLIQGGEPCYTQGVNCADCWSRAPFEAACLHMHDVRGHNLVSSQQCDSDALIHPRDRRNKPSCPSVHLPAEAKASRHQASRHHHGCLCGTSILHVRKRNWPKPGNLHRLFGSRYENTRSLPLYCRILYCCIYFRITSIYFVL